MQNSKKPLVLALLGAVSVGYSVAANAAIRWEFPDNPTNCVSTDPTGNCGSGQFSDSRTYSGDDGATATTGTLVTVEGWSSTADLASGGTNNALQQGQITHYSGGLGVQNADAIDYNDVNPGTSTQTDLGEGWLNDDEKNVLRAWETQFDVSFDGPNPLPVENYLDSSEASAIEALLNPKKDAGEQTSPEHAVDNNDRFDLVLFDFGTNLVTLSHIGMGYIDPDSDISLLAFKGTGTPDLTNVEYSQTGEGLTDAGWVHVGDYSNVGSFTAVNTGTDPVHSTHWIVAAYNPVFDNPGWTFGNDAFKIDLVKGTIYTPPPGPGPNPAPIPGTALLLLSGLAVARFRKRWESA